MSPTSIGESSLLLWIMAAVVALQAAYLYVGWIRRAQWGGGRREILGALLLASGALGAGVSSSVVLALSAEGLSFALGYRWLAVPALVLGPMVAALPAAWWLSRRQNWLALGVCGLWLGAVALAVQLGWIVAAGLRPGIRPQLELLGAGGAIAALGFIASLWLAFSDSSSEGARKTLWRLGAAALLALTLVAGQEVVLSSIGLMSQVGSIYKAEAGATWMCLVAGALVPTIMAMMSLDLALRNRADRRNTRMKPGAVELNLPKRRKRRRKYRAL